MPTEPKKLAKPAKSAKAAPGSDPTFVAIKRMLEACRDPDRHKFIRFDEPGRYEVRTDIHDDGGSEGREYMIPFAFLEDKRGVKLTLFPLLEAVVRKRMTPRLRAFALTNGKAFAFKTAPDAATLRDLASLIEFANGVWYSDTT